jgi:endonuclease/exonuclease/phosphatase family metal-dependent hydrolase
MPTFFARHSIIALLCTLPVLTAACSDAPEDPSRFNSQADTSSADTAADQGVPDPDARAPLDIADGTDDRDIGSSVDAISDADAATPDAPSPDVRQPDASADATPRPDSDAVVAPDTNTPDGQITIATWNVRRLFDTSCDSGLCDEDDFEVAYSDPQFNFRITQVVAGIEALDADIVLLQEVETEVALSALTAALDGRYTVSLIGETDFDASLDVAVVGNATLVELTTHRQNRIPLTSGGTTTFAREFLELELDFAGHTVIVFNAHFKSQNADDPARRQAEGRAAAAIVNERISERADALIILGGDLNDTPGSPAIDAIEASGSLLRVASELGDAAGTVTFDGVANALDHLFVCRSACSGGYVSGSAEVVRSSGSQALSGSDHAGLRARFTLD